MLQLLCHVAMEPPVDFSADEVRNEKVKVLVAVPQPTAEQIPQIAVRAQYGAGHAGGEDVPGYTEEEGVPPDSRTETYVAMRLEVDNWRWAGVPFYLRTGKRLARKITEIAVTLKPVPHLAFSQDGSLGVQPNQLVLTLQPNEGVSLQLGAKIPGTRMIIRTVNMEFLYGTAFLSQSPEAYERLITDAMRGDATLCTRNAEGEAQWRICDPIVKAWASTRQGRCRELRSRLSGTRAGRAAAERRPSLARDLMSRSDAVWSAQGTTPDAIEAALRELLIQRHTENDRYEPARVLNMIAFVDREWTGEIANRLRSVGRYHASRLVVLAYEPRRERLDARVSIATEGSAAPGELALLRETVVVELGDRHLDDLVTIADPLVITDLPTLLWSPHGHHEIVARLLALAQAVLIDSVDEPLAGEALDRACTLSDQAYVVDLAWLRSTPWRERLAASFDPPGLRGELQRITSVTVRHHPASTVAAMLLTGWLASRLRLGAERSSSLDGDALAAGKARRRARTSRCGSKAAPELQVRGLEGLTLRDRRRTRARASTAAREGCGPARATRAAQSADGRSRRLARRERRPRRGHPPGAAARSDLPAGAASAGDAAVGVVGDGVTRLTTCADARGGRRARGRPTSLRELRARARAARRRAPWR